MYLLKFNIYIYIQIKGYGAMDDGNVQTHQMDDKIHQAILSLMELCSTFSLSIIVYF